MSEYAIRIDIGGLIPEGSPIGKAAFPHLVYTMAKLAERGHQIWQGYARGEPLPSGKSLGVRSGRYLESIQLRQLGDFEWEIYSDSPYSDSIENGSPARDLKKMLDTSMRVRLTKDGRRYLIIPFRWGTPGTTTFGKNAMPDLVHSMWRGMKASRETGEYQRQSGTGAYDIRTRRPATVAQARYKWGDRMTAQLLREAGVVGRQARHMAGMVKMQSPTGTGGGKHTGYMTFRVMMEGSSGWIAPAREGLYPARTMMQELEPQAQRAIESAVTRDIQKALPT